MPDSSNPRRGEGAPMDWAEAFAQLPLEAPPTDSRRRFEQALQARARQADAPRRDRRGTWAVGLASAAVLALVIVAPMLNDAMRGSATPATPTPGPRVATAVDAHTPAATIAPATQARTPTTSPASRAADAPAPTQLQLAQRALPGLEIAPSAVDRQRARRATDQLVATLDLARIAQVPAVPSTADTLEELRLRSQRLQALVALARDDRVSSPAGAFISGELEDTLARLDTELQRPGLDDTRRVALWQQRVDALEHLAGLESTQRWLAAQGMLLDTGLVSVD
ncbi:hypothetical protein [Agrilutibacter solisilvae]|uniref:Uncharacterized protein n=1 Tax=Agrilutibacter solisilvae TaxID=2763317 RepID=A0A975ATF2_9GAMM|nr:hypothetical protein [Lysobacter solisilvae]QSX79762.1 hypothetical protein I8J32_008000 [Lysobacter solisilvae]